MKLLFQSACHYEHRVVDYMVICCCWTGPESLQDIIVVFLVPYFANFNILISSTQFSIFTYWPSVMYVSDQNRCYQHGMAVG